MACIAPKPIQLPSQWCVENLRFDEASNRGPFKTVGTEYIIDVLDDFANPLVSDEVLVWGSQTHKTGTLMGGVAWGIRNDPCGFLWVMPNETLVAKFSRQRLMPMIRASDCLAELIPTGNRRHDFATGAMMLGGSVLNFMGSNSPANLSSNPCRKVVLDEVDKFDEGGTSGEADAVNLAEQRTKDQRDPQRWKTSTPTLVTGLIWQEFEKGNQMRWFMPCPKCGVRVVFAWSKEYSILPKTGSEAYVRWNSEAKRGGHWNYGEVRATSHFECPHCKHWITESDKPEMNRRGEWKATYSHSRAGFISRHLPSLACASPETSIGAIAVRFLEAKRSLLGLRGFINGDLAEPYVSQDTVGARIEMVTKEATPEGDEWARLMTIDCQQKAPHFWWVVRAWAIGKSEGIEYGHCETWEELREVQLRLKVPDAQVMVDSGYGSRSDADVYRNCVKFCELESRPGELPLALGWMPAKGLPNRTKWKDTDGLMMPFRLQPTDPFMGQQGAGQCEISLFEFSGDLFKDVLNEMRADQKKEKFQWLVSKQMNEDEYWRHLDGETKSPVVDPRTGRVQYIWKRRNFHWPNHLNDCEVMQVALAMFFKLVTINE